MFDNQYFSYFRRYYRQTPFPHASGDGGNGGSAISYAAIAGVGSVAILIIIVVVIAILSVLCCNRRKPLNRCCVLAIAHLCNTGKMRNLYTLAYIV